MHRVFVMTLAAGLTAAASGCIAVVKEGGDHSKPKPVAAAPMEGRGTVDPTASLDRTPEGDLERVSVEVRYVNDSGRTLKSVTIWCRALDRDGYEVASQQVGLMSGSVGPMTPGFKAKRWISFVEKPGAVTSVACDVTAAQ